MAGEFLRSLEGMTRLHDLAIERPARRKEAKVREQDAERKLKLKKKLMEEAELKIDTGIEDLEAKKRRQQVEYAALSTVGVSDQASFDNLVKEIPPEILQEWNINPKKSFEDNIDAITAAQQQGIYTIDHLQKIDIERRKAAAEASSTKQPTWTPDPQGKAITGEARGQIGVSMANDPEFSHLHSMFTGPAESKEFQAALSMTGNHIQTLVNEINLRNDQRSKVDPSAKPEGVDLNKLQNIAEERTKAYMFKGTDTKMFGGKYLEYMSMSEAAKDEESYIQRMQVEYLKDPKYFKMYNENPAQFMEFMRRQYLIHKIKAYKNAKQRLYQGINIHTQ